VNEGIASGSHFRLIFLKLLIGFHLQGQVLGTQVLQVAVQF
jgi:hypothetical protein